MRFSVVITAFNLRRYLGEAIDSVLSQTRSPDEVVVVDDGSTDDSAAWVEKEYAPYDSVTVIRKKNGGQLSAFRAGVSGSSGEVVCFLDADDLWRRSYLERLERLYGERPDVGAVYANVHFFGPSRDRLWRADEEDRDLGLSVLKTYLTQGSGWDEAAPTSAISMRRPLVEEILSLPESFDADWRVRADDVLVFGAAICGARRYFLAEPLVEYREHDANLWLGRELDACKRMQHALRRHALIRQLGRRLEPSTGLERLLTKELETKPRPRPKDLRAYLRIVRDTPGLSWRRRWTLRHSLRRCYRRLRRRSPA